MKVKDMLNPTVVTTPPDTDFQTMLRRFACQPQRLLHVVDAAGTLLGVISSVDLLGLLAPAFIDSNLAKALPEDYDVRLVKKSFEEHKHLTARDVMRAKVITLKPDDLFLRVETLIREQGLNTLPVVDAGGKLLGEISRKEVLRHLAVHCAGCHCEED